MIFQHEKIGANRCPIIIFRIDVINSNEKILDWRVEIMAEELGVPSEDCNIFPYV
jgi:hypothetical protein